MNDLCHDSIGNKQFGVFSRSDEPIVIGICGMRSADQDHRIGSEPIASGSFLESGPVRRQAIVWTNAAKLSIGPSGTNSNEFESRYKLFHTWKRTWKCRLQNGGHFVKGRWVSIYNLNTTRIPSCRLWTSLQFRFVHNVYVTSCRLVIHKNPKAKLPGLYLCFFYLNLACLGWITIDMYKL